MVQIDRGRSGRRRDQVAADQAGRHGRQPDALQERRVSPGPNEFEHAGGDVGRRGRIRRPRPLAGRSRGAARPGGSGRRELHGRNRRRVPASPDAFGRLAVAHPRGLVVVARRGGATGLVEVGGPSLVDEASGAGPAAGALAVDGQQRGVPEQRRTPVPRIANRGGAGRTDYARRIRVCRRSGIRRVRQGNAAAGAIGS